MATAMVKKSTVWKGSTAMAMSIEADGGLDGNGNDKQLSDRRGFNNISEKTAGLQGALEAFWYLPCPHICRTTSLISAQSFGVYFQSKFPKLCAHSRLVV